jgi:hypothetical protein
MEAPGAGWMRVHLRDVIIDAVRERREQAHLVEVEITMVKP